MKRNEYLSKLNDLRDPYGQWIAGHEKKRPAEEQLIPEGYRLIADLDGRIDPGLTSALRDYGVFTGLYDLIYTDEDVEENGKRQDPFFKPDYSPDTLDEFYYPGGLTIVSSAIDEEVRNTTDYLPGSTDFLRECAKRSRFPLHIPEVLFHAGNHKTYEYSSRETDSDTLGINPRDMLSVVILSKDHPDLCRKCISGLLRSAEREKITARCIIIDNGSSPENEGKYELLADDFNVSYYREEAEFNYSTLCNLGVRKTRGRYILFLNDDVEFPEDTFILSEMITEASKTTTGAVGVKLLYPGEKKIQHAGITLLKSGASHKLAGYDDSVSYYHGINRRKINVFAVTGACLMTERRKFEEAGGFDERLEVAYTDVDLCAAFITHGYYNVCLNGCNLIHHESLTRNRDAGDPEKFARLVKERELFYNKHRLLIKNGDPFYNINLTDTGLDYRVNVPDTLESVPFHKELPEVGIGEGPVNIRIRDEEMILCRKSENGKQIRYNIEKIEHLLSDACGNEDVLEISGWGFVTGEHGYERDIHILIKSGDRHYLADSGRVFREDLPKVFPDEKDLLLSGFAVKVRASFFETLPAREDISIVLERKGVLRRKGFIGK